MVPRPARPGTGTPAGPQGPVTAHPGRPALSDLSNTHSVLYLDAVPERHMVLDLAGERARVRVVPGGVLAGQAVRADGVVAGQSLPRADAPVRAQRRRRATPDAPR